MHRLHPAAPRPVLVVEDTEDDFDTVVQAARRMHLANRLVHAIDASVAGALLAARPAGSYAFMLLDYNLPGVDGLAFLQALRADPAHYNLPVVVFTASVNPRDRAAFEAAGANAYHVKALRFEECLDTLEEIFIEWLT